MNNKSSRKASLSLILIVVFTIFLLVVVVLASWRNNATSQLLQTVNELGKQDRSIHLADKSIEKFYSLENAFRLYTATGQERFRTQYTEGFIDLKIMLDSLQHSTRIYQSDKSTLLDLLKKKDVETNMYLHLKSINDSLILATAELKNIKPISKAAFKPLSAEEAKIFIDKTTVVQEQKSQRKLLGRIKDAIVNKTPNQTSTVTTLNKVQGSTLEGDQSLNALNELLKTSIDELTFNFQQLSENEKRLILNNDRLLTRLSNILMEFKGLQIELQNLRQKELNKDAEVSIIKLSNLSRLILMISLILVLVILYNVWELYKHDKKLLAAKNEAIRQKQIRGDFLSHMSHEIRTPLNSILGFSEQLENSELDTVQREQITSIRQSSNILLSIVNDVLDLSKFETGNLNLHTSNFYPVKTINHVVSSLQVLAVKKNIRLFSTCGMDNELRIAGDEYRLKQVLINLINNAIKFTDAGEVVVSANMAGQYLLVDISDTGRGIAREHLSGIFDEFTQIAKPHDNEKQNGSGLGLAICKKIIEAQDGNITVTSQLGKGSVFSFRIPYLPFQAVLETDVKIRIKPELDTAVFNLKKVLIAEDDKMNIKLISTIFNKWGLAFDVVENGIKAFELFEKESYDMLLTDIHMPERDGISLTKLIRSYPDLLKSRLPILAITANAMQKDLDEYKAIGMNDHIIKPFSEEKLFEKIRNNMGKEALL